MTLAGFHALNHSMYELARDYARRGMMAYTQLQQREFEMAEKHGYRRSQASELCRDGVL